MSRAAAALVGALYLLTPVLCPAQNPGPPAMPPPPQVNFPSPPSMPPPGVPGGPAPTFPSGPQEIAPGAPNFPQPTSAPAIAPAAPPAAMPNMPVQTAPPPVGASGSPVTPPAAGGTASSDSPGRGDYYSGDHHFWFTPPSDWAAMPAPELRAIISASTITYDTGYRHQGTITPYLLVQVLPGLAGDPKDGVEGFQKLGVEAVYDDNRKCLIARQQLSRPGVPPMKVTSFYFVGKREVVAVHCYQFLTDSDYSPVFETIADSFHFDPGWDFKSRGFMESPLGKILAGGGEGARIGGTVGALTGILLTIILALWKRLR